VSSRFVNAVSRPDHDHGRRSTDHSYSALHVAMTGFYIMMRIAVILSAVQWYFKCSNACQGLSYAFP